MREVEATIHEWIDGDTVEVLVYPWRNLCVTERVRVFGINSPEVHSKNAAEKAAGEAARQFACGLAKPFSIVKIREQGQDKYGRFLASIELDGGKDFATTMIESGHAVAYDGGKKWQSDASTP